MNWETIRTVGKPLLLLAGLLFLVLFVIGHWDESSELLNQTNLSFFIASILVALADNLVFCLLFFWLTRKHHLDAPFSKVGEMFFFGQLAKYIPGRFWNFLYQSTYFNSKHALRQILAANLELMGLSIWRNLIIGISLALVLTHQLVAALLFLTGCIGFTLLIRLDWLAWIKKLMPRKTALSGSNPSDVPIAAVMTLTFCGTSFFYLTANYLLLVKAFGFSLSEAILFTAMFSLAWIVGVAAFIVPAGIGVREAVFVVLAANMESEHSVGTLATIAIIYRFWQIFHEVGAIGLGFYFRIRSK